MSEREEIAAAAAAAFASAYARAEKDHYCYREIAAGELELCMADAEHFAVCPVCGTELRIVWTVDDDGVRWNRWDYRGRDGLLW